ncbi:MAG TPA: hypothetical protein PKC98_02345, partial [Candidatus Melainabacteria bacterium]|nr:hypothetical protein [Candidatus Melainabacteria bacterium]
IAMTIIKAHGGTIELESELNKGSTFTVRLPVYDSKPAELAAGGNGNEEVADKLEEDDKKKVTEPDEKVPTSSN